MSHVRKAFAVATLFFAVGCGGARATPTLGPVPIEARLFQDNAGGMRSQTETVIRDAASLNTAWQQATSEQASKPPVPTIDFERQMVLVVGGGRMSIVDGIRVDSVGTRQEMSAAGRREEVLAVYYSLIKGCPPTTREAYPVEMVRVRQFAGTVRFVPATIKGPGC